MFFGCSIWLLCLLSPVPKVFSEIVAPSFNAKTSATTFGEGLLQLRPLWVPLVDGVLSQPEALNEPCGDAWRPHRSQKSGSSGFGIFQNARPHPKIVLGTGRPKTAPTAPLDINFSPARRQQNQDNQGPEMDYDVLHNRIPIVGVLPEILQDSEKAHGNAKQTRRTCCKRPPVLKRSARFKTMVNKRFALLNSKRPLNQKTLFFHAVVEKNM